jgi:hypothetical protein
VVERAVFQHQHEDVLDTGLAMVAHDGIGAPMTGICIKLKG